MVSQRDDIVAGAVVFALAGAALLALVGALALVW